MRDTVQRPGELSYTLRSQRSQRPVVTRQPHSVLPRIAQMRMDNALCASHPNANGILASGLYWLLESPKMQGTVCGNDYVVVRLHLINEAVPVLTPARVNSPWLA